MYTHAHTRSYMTCVSVMRSCAYTCVIHPYVTLGYIYFVLRLHLLFVSSSSPCRPGFLQLRPCALFLLGGTLLATPPRPSALLRYAFSLVSSSLFSLSLSLSLSLTILDLIRFVVQCCSRCDYMPEVPAASTRCRSLGGV